MTTKANPYSGDVGGAYIIEVCGSFGGFPPFAWRDHIRFNDRAEAKKACSSLTGHHYRAARVRHHGKIIHQSGVSA